MQGSEKVESTTVIPKLGARAQSLINNKPTQQHRIIKDRSNSVVSTGSVSEKRPALIPISNSENIRGSFDSCIQGGPSALLKLEKAGAGDSETKDHLRRRIKELEKEVLKLTNHIHQAELSIRNYRVSLSEKGPRTPNNSKDGCSQTEGDETSRLQAALKSTQDKLTATLEELRSLKDVKDSLFSERKQLQDANKRKEEFMLVAVQANEETIAKQRVQIRELEDRLKMTENVRAETSGNNNGSADSRPLTASPINDASLELMLQQLAITHKLKTELSKTKAQLVSEVDFMCIAMRSDYDLLLEKVAQKAQNSTVQHLQQRQILVKENARLAAMLSNKESELITARAELQSLTLLSESLTAAHFKPTTETGTNTLSHSPERRAASTSTPSTPINAKRPAPAVATPILTPPAPAPVLQDRCLSPLSPLAHRSKLATQALQAANAAAAVQADQQIQAKLRIAEKDAEIDQLQQRIAQDRLHLQQQSDDLDTLRTRLLTERERFDKICTEQERLLAQRTAQCMNDRLRADAYQAKLLSASQALVGLEEVHQAEVKAVKHEAHVKDLLRVAKEREAALEKDKLQIELKHIKEIQHILTFSLSTAEQSLNETQPQVVEKLVQGREKRLKLLDLTTNGRRKDLDQRSADTCAVNSAHLDGFQKKAAANNIIAKEMTLAATKKLLAILQEESGGGGAGAGGGGGGACVSGVAISSGGSSGVAGGGYVTPGKGKGDGVKASVSVSSGRLLV